MQIHDKELHHQPLDPHFCSLSLCFPLNIEQVTSSQSSLLFTKRDQWNSLGVNCYVRFHLRTSSSSTRSAFELSEPAFLWTSDKLSASIESLFCYHSPLKASFQRNHVCSKKVRSLNLLARPHPYYRGRGFYKSWPNVGAGQRLSIIILLYWYYISILVLY